MPTKKQDRQKPPVTLCGITDKKVRQQALDVAIRAFTRPEGMERHLALAQWQGEIFDPEDTRVVVAEGRAVSMVVITPRTIRFGPVKVPAMTVGPVGTHDHYRKRGYSTAVMNDASARMKAKGILIAYLVGISGFYNRLGYYPFMARSTVKFSREPAGAELRPGKLRAMTRKDLPRVRRLYDEATAGRICAAARDDKVWDWLLGPASNTWTFPAPKLILDTSGRLCGYLTMEPKGELNIREIVVRQEDESCRVALGAMVREARRRETKEITLPLPWDDALTLFLRQYVRAEFTMTSDATGGALMKIVDFPALMRRLEPLFSQRWKRAGKTLAAAKFTLSSEIGAVGLTVTRGGVRVGDPAGGSRVRIPQRWLSGMITGYYPLRDIAPRQGATVPSRLMPVLDVLFPQGWPFVWQGDNM